MSNPSVLSAVSALTHQVLVILGGWSVFMHRVAPLKTLHRKHLYLFVLCVLVVLEVHIRDLKSKSSH